MSGPAGKQSIGLVSLLVPYGTVAVFRELYGNLWDLLGPPAVNHAPPPEPASNINAG